MKSPFAIALIQEAVSIEIDMEIDIDPKLEKRKRIVKRLVRSKRPTGNTRPCTDVKVQRR